MVHGIAAREAGAVGVLPLIVGCLLLVASFAAPPLAAAACSGVSPSLTAATWADIQGCHDVASAGDTITYTGGTTSASSLLSITRYVKITASGNPIITDISRGGDPDAGGGPSLITIAESTAGHTRLQGFTFQKGPGNCRGASSTTGVHCGTAGTVKIVSTVNGKPVLITGNTFRQGRSGNSIVANTNRGVIWDNAFIGNFEVLSSEGGLNRNCGNNASALRHKPTTFTASWTSPPKYGTADTNGDENLYFESNAITYMGEAIDTDDNGRTVIRHNTFTNGGVILHGVDTSGIYGARYIEYYNNELVFDQTPQPACGGLPSQPMLGVTLRGGTALIHSNVIPDISGPAWGTKYAIAFSVEQLRRRAGGFPCWSTLTAPGASYPSPHQVGWGYSTGATTVTGSGCVNCPIRQDIEPVYLWGNTGGGNYNAPSIANYDCGSGDVCPNCTTCPLVATYIKAGRDYFTDTAKPGYTPYRYPHPATGVGAPSQLQVR